MTTTTVAEPERAAEEPDLSPEALQRRLDEIAEAIARLRGEMPGLLYDEAAQLSGAAKRRATASAKIADLEDEAARLRLILAEAQRRQADAEAEEQEAAAKEMKERNRQTLWERAHPTAGPLDGHAGVLVAARREMGYLGHHLEVGQVFTLAGAIHDGKLLDQGAAFRCGEGVECENCKRRFDGDLHLNQHVHRNSCERVLAE